MQVQNVSRMRMLVAVLSATSFFGMTGSSEAKPAPSRPNARQIRQTPLTQSVNNQAVRNSTFSPVRANSPLQQSRPSLIRPNNGLPNSNLGTPRFQPNQPTANRGVQFPNQGQQGRPAINPTRGINKNPFGNNPVQRPGGNLNQIEQRKPLPKVFGPVGRSYVLNSAVAQNIRVNTQRMNHMRDNSFVKGRVDFYAQQFHNQHEKLFFDRGVAYANFFAAKRNVCKPLFHLGFHGGFYWGLHRIENPTAYFFNPLFAWFFVESVDAACISAWYAPTYVVYPRAYPVNAYRMVYFPTPEFRDMVVTVSTYEPVYQTQFQRGMIQLTNLIGQKIANLTGRAVTLGENDVVITHQQVLQNAAAVVEGFVDYGGTQYNFEGFINLQNPQTTSIIPTQVYLQGDPNIAPSQEDINTLERIDNQVSALGGIVDRTDD